MLVLGFLKLSFESVELLGLFVMGGPILGERSGEFLKLGLKFLGFVGGRLGRDEGTGLEAWICKGAMEPDAELPGDLENGEGAAVISGEGVVCGIPTAADFVEELMDLPGDDAVVPESPEKFVLAFLRLIQDADAGGNELSEKLGELAEL